jgi:hypothetical protein
MSSSKSEEDMAAVRRKVAQLEAKQKIQRMGMRKELIKVQQAMEKRDRETEKKELEAKIEKMEFAFQNERRDRLLEDERRERLAEKKEMLATLENERRDTCRMLDDERRERLAENERRDTCRMLEDERRERLAEKKEMMATLENERRERLAEKKEMMAALEKKDEKKEMMVTLEKKEMMAKLEKHEREHQHQIEQLKSEARISQMEQQLLEVRAYTSQGIPISRSTVQRTTATVDPAPQRETELLLLQHIQQMEKEREQLKATRVQPMAISTDNNSTDLPAPDASHPKTLQPASHKSAVVPHTSQIVSKQASQISSLQAPKPNVPSASIAPSRSTQQQHQVAAAPPQGNTKTTQGRPVPLPGDSDNHFFLSHCQSTGGDQTNAIYLELRQLGFACWYDNRADDLTKEGMRQGIVQAAAFLLFLSTGVLDRPFCEYLYISSSGFHFHFTLFLLQASLRSERP